jgi:ketosteroid isomerase-like protein
MSQDNVETVKASFRAWNAGDREGWAEPMHPEGEWSSAIVRQVEGADTVYRGKVGLMRFWDEWHAVWNMEMEITETRDLGDTVLVLAIIRTRGHASGVPTDRRMGYVFDFEDGRVRRGRAYLNADEALAAAGLGDSR